jgi:hypothetical protein
MHPLMLLRNIGRHKQVPLAPTKANRSSSSHRLTFVQTLKVRMPRQSYSNSAHQLSSLDTPTPSLENQHVLLNVPVLARSPRRQLVGRALRGRHVWVQCRQYVTARVGAAVFSAAFSSLLAATSRRRPPHVPIRTSQFAWHNARSKC